MIWLANDQIELVNLSRWPDCFIPSLSKRVCFQKKIRIFRKLRLSKLTSQKKSERFKNRRSESQNCIFTWRFAASFNFIPKESPLSVLWTVHFGAVHFLRPPNPSQFERFTQSSWMRDRPLSVVSLNLLVEPQWNVQTRPLWLNTVQFGLKLT